MVCGSPEIDIKLLESVTEYSSCSANDTHVRIFWKALQEFTNEERSALIRFTWGRSRLPLTAAAFPQRFKKRLIKCFCICYPLFINMS